MRGMCPSYSVFAVILAAIGALSFYDAAFGVVWDRLPGASAVKHGLFVLTALVSLAAGIGLLVRRTRYYAGWLIFAALIAWLVVVRLPAAVMAPGIGTIWACSKVAVIAAAAWAVSGAPGLRVGQALYGAALIPFGVAHFLYLPQTSMLIPAWLGWANGWAWFTGGALIVAGVAIMLRVYAKLATALSALEMALIGLFVWLPRTLAGELGDFQRGEAIITLTLTSAAWVVADSYRSRRWFAARA